MRSIGVLIKPASGLCNMRCDYCFYADETANRQISSYGIMTRQTLKNVIRRTLLPCEGAYSIAFQGIPKTTKKSKFTKIIFGLFRLFRVFSELPPSFLRLFDVKAAMDKNPLQLLSSLW